MRDTLIRIWLTKISYFVIRPLVYAAEFLKISPSGITTLGLVMNVIAAIIFIKGAWAETAQLTYYIGYGGLMIQFAAAFDLVDGLIARKLNKVSAFGAFYDSVIDRYSDLLLYTSIGFTLLIQGYKSGAMLCLLSLVAAVMISYTAARAGTLNTKVARGLMPREVRIMSLAVGGWICGLVGYFTGGNINIYSNEWINIDITSIFLIPLAATAFFGNITVLQRIKSVYIALR